MLYDTIEECYNDNINDISFDDTTSLVSYKTIQTNFDEPSKLFRQLDFKPFKLPQNSVIIASRTNNIDRVSDEILNVENDFLEHI